MIVEVLVAEAVEEASCGGAVEEGVAVGFAREAVFETADVGYVAFCCIDEED